MCIARLQFGFSIYCYSWVLSQTTKNMCIMHMMVDASPCFSQVQFKVGVALFLLLFLYQYFSTGAENIYLLCSSSLKAECIV